MVALDYRNPHLNLYQEFQQWKRHPMVSRLLEGGTCLQVGGRWEQGEVVVACCQLCRVAWMGWADCSLAGKAAQHEPFLPNKPAPPAPGQLSSTARAR